MSAKETGRGVGLRRESVRIAKTKQFLGSRIALNVRRGLSRGIEQGEKCSSNKERG